MVFFKKSSLFFGELCSPSCISILLKRIKIHLGNFQPSLIKYSSLEEQLEIFLRP